MIKKFVEAPIASISVESMATALQEEMSSGVEMCRVQEITQSLDMPVMLVWCIQIYEYPPLLSIQNYSCSRVSSCCPTSKRHLL